jgi:phosphoribosylaminoimidazolecarboxamide formyltransferase/IMP cyclohydrolase
MGRLALLSVSDKTAIVELGRQLIQEFDFELISSGGTAKTLRSGGLPVTKVSDYTGSPEILGGRVKTLHPRIHGGILARRDLEGDMTELEAHHIRALDLVAVNLYPFAETIAKGDVSVAEAIEQIDIGGPAMLRAAAKNFAHVTVLPDPKYYHLYLEELRQHEGQTSLAFRQQMAAETFTLTNAYELVIADYLASLTARGGENNLPERFTLAGRELQSLRYGENPHQSASWYQTGSKASGWAAATKLQGKELSYNNLVDLEAARRLIAEFDLSEPAAAILKHTNPCGLAVGTSLAGAYQKAFNADPVSAFGGIVALNRPLDADTATALTKTFLECIVAPGCDSEAQAILSKKSNLRVLVLPDLVSGPKHSVKVMAGGFLVQAADDTADNPESWQVVTARQPSPEMMAELLFAWKAAKHVKSNAIVITKGRTTFGVGAGQMNRVGSVEIALKQAREAARGGFLASDGFFPFDDSVRAAAAAGIVGIVQPGGSLRDRDSIAAADELGLVMVMTGMRHFLH